MHICGHIWYIHVWLIVYVLPLFSYTTLNRCLSFHSCLASCCFLPFWCTSTRPNYAPKVHKILMDCPRWTNDINLHTANNSITQYGCPFHDFNIQKEKKYFFHTWVAPQSWGFSSTSRSVDEPNYARKCIKNVKGI